MAQDEEFVSARLFRNSIAAQMAQTQQVLILVEALVKILQHQKLLPPELVTRFLDESSATAQAEKTREAIARLRGDEELAFVLKDFEGTIQ
jgi:hypothetical protein